MSCLMAGPGPSARGMTFSRQLGDDLQYADSDDAEVESDALFDDAGVDLSEGETRDE